MLLRLADPIDTPETNFNLFTDGDDIDSPKPLNTADAGN